MTKNSQPVSLNPKSQSRRTLTDQTSRFVMIGGFLGSGKTTAILQFARWAYEQRGWKVAVITNDQAQGLVDTSLATGARFAVHEIGGGCFCCQSGTLMEAMEGFAKKLKPEILIGEPVGSCTDLASTVLGPLRTIYKTDYRLSPLSVLVDPFRAARIVGAEGAGVAGFSEEVNYIYRKQLEEAEMIVVNKSDVYERKRLAALGAALAGAVSAGGGADGVGADGGGAGGLVGAAAGGDAPGGRVYAGGLWGVCGGGGAAGVGEWGV